MDRNKRTIWIIIGVILALSCCCILVIGTAAALFVTRGPVVTEAGFAQVSERTEQVFPVDEAPTLEVDNWAGNIAVRKGEVGEIAVTITKRARNESRLNSIRVDVSQSDDGVQIRAWRDAGMTGNLSAEFEIVVPPDAKVVLETGAGNITVDGVEGEIGATTQAGNVEVHGAEGSVTMETGAGEVDYEGEPSGRCTFRTGAGNITLRLPTRVDADVEFDTGLGEIDLGGFDVRGDVSSTDVNGRIGTGGEATLDAHTGLGSISLMRK